MFNVSAFFEGDGSVWVTSSIDGRRVRTVAFTGKNLRKLSESLGVRNSWRHGAVKGLWTHVGMVSILPAWLQ